LQANSQSHLKRTTKNIHTKLGLSHHKYTLVMVRDSKAVTHPT